MVPLRKTYVILRESKLIFTLKAATCRIYFSYFMRWNVFKVVFWDVYVTAVRWLKECSNRKKGSLFKTSVITGHKREHSLLALRASCFILLCSAGSATQTQQRVVLFETFRPSFNATNGNKKSSSVFGSCFESV